MCERIIHQIWMQGLDRAPEYFRSYSKRIRDMHPDWPYMFWDEARIQSLVGTQDAWRSKYATFVHLHQRVDFAKLLIIFTHGGIVIDADAYTVRKLDSLFDEHADASLIVSEVRQFAKPVGWIQSLLGCGDTGKCINNGSYIGKARSRVLAAMIDRLLAVPGCEPSTGKMSCIQATTGPPVFHRLVREYARDPTSRVVVLEYTTLEPCLSTLCEISERTYVAHAHELTWCSPAFVWFVRLYVRHHAIVNVGVILFILMVLALISFLVYRIIARSTKKTPKNSGA
jgi:mannosyltransferase OCH1-like enzyme